MNDTERYLKAATRGLWGQERKALRAELKGHIGARIQEFRLGGLNEAEAERQTLRELGAPAQVSRGMLGVHTLPALGKAGALTALLATAVLSVVPQGLAQVSGTFLKPDGAFSASSYLDYGELKVELKKNGAALTGTLQNPFISIPGVPRPNMPLNTVQMPGFSFTQAGHQYIAASMVLNGLRSAGADVRLSGWDPMQIQANQTVLKVQTGGDRRVPNVLYTECLSSLSAESGIPIMQAVEANGDTATQTFQGAVAEGQIYALVVPVFSTWWTMEGSVRKVGGNLLLSADTNQVSGGTVLLRKYGVNDPYKLYASVEAFQKALDPYRAESKINHWDAKHPAPALLLELSGHFGRDAYTVVDPATVKGTLQDH